MTPNDTSSPTPLGANGGAQNQGSNTQDVARNAEKAFGAAPLLGDDFEIPYELDNVDADIREYYLADYYRRYLPGMPIKIQISRLLKKLIDSNARPNNRKSAQNDI